MACETINLQEGVAGSPEQLEEWTLTGMENADEGEFSIYENLSCIHGSALAYNTQSQATADHATGSEGGGYLAQGGWWKWTFEHGYEPTSFTIEGATGDCVNYSLTKTKDYIAAVPGSDQITGVGVGKIRIDSGDWIRFFQASSAEQLQAILTAAGHAVTVTGVAGEWSIHWTDGQPHTVEVDSSALFGGSIVL